MSKNLCVKQQLSGTPVRLRARPLLLLAASWIFMPSTYSHTPPVRPYVEALPEPQYYYWNYQRTNIRGTDGSWDSYNRRFYHAPQR